MPRHLSSAMLLLAAALFLLPAPALAYIGPGAGLSAIGTVLALLAAVVLAVFGFVWYPVKRLVGKRQKSKTQAAPPGQAEQD